MLKSIEPDLKAHFRPEFLNRIDDIIVFNPLGEEVVKKIVEVLLRDVAKRLEAKNIKVSFSDNLKKHLMDVGYDREFGARPMKRAITNVIMNGLSTKILS
jgi:ATP-dependent Clp protease ATP-binding subunit ClpA